MAGHAAVLGASIAAHYKYGDRTDVLDRSLKGSEAVLSELQRRIAFRLGMRLQPVFNNPPQLISATDRRIVGPCGEPLPEILVNPAGSEEYKDALHAFLQTDVLDIVDCRRLIDARNAWQFWARCLSWAIWALIFTEFISLAGLAVGGTLAAAPIPHSVIASSFAITAAVFLLGCLAPSAFMLWNHDRITELRMRYAPP